MLAISVYVGNFACICGKTLTSMKKYTLGRHASKWKVPALMENY